MRLNMFEQKKPFPWVPVIIAGGGILLVAMVIRRADPPQTKAQAAIANRQALRGPANFKTDDIDVQPKQRATLPAGVGVQATTHAASGIPNMGCSGAGCLKGGSQPWN